MTKEGEGLFQKSLSLFVFAYGKNITPSPQNLYK